MTDIRPHPSSLFAQVAAIEVLQPDTLRGTLRAIEFAGLVRLQHARIGSRRGAPIDRLHGITAGNETRCSTHQIVHFVGSRHVVAVDYHREYTLYSLYSCSFLFRSVLALCSTHLTIRFCTSICRARRHL